MNAKKLNWILSATLLVGAAACGGDDNKSSGGGGGGGGGTSTTAKSFQQQGVDNGQLELNKATLEALNADSLAVTVKGGAKPATALPAGLDAADYFGAVDPAAATPWWQGWAYVHSDVDGNLPGTNFHPLEAEITGGSLAPLADASGEPGTDGGTVSVFGKTFPVRLLPSAITADTTLKAGVIWLMKGTVKVGTGDVELKGAAPSSTVTLTVEPGAQLMAVEDTATALVITRGSKLVAEGTAALPIILASVKADAAATGNKITGDPTDLTKRGEWGGLVLSGLGVDNSANADGELLTEAAPQGEERYFGGKNNADSSGSIKYMIIAESGFEFRADQEVQGLTLEAAGSGTTIEHLQVIGSEDDCIEWFGGAAPGKWLLCQGADDDGLDIDEGYVGTIQFAIVRIGAKNGDRGIESDNNGDNFAQTPVSAPKLANITILGNTGKKSKSYAALHREGFAGQVYRSVFTDDTAAGAKFPAGGVDVDDSLPAGLLYRDVVVNTSPVLVDDDK